MATYIWAGEPSVEGRGDGAEEAGCAEFPNVQPMYSGTPFAAATAAAAATAFANRAPVATAVMMMLHPESPGSGDNSNQSHSAGDEARTALQP